MELLDLIIESRKGNRRALEKIICNFTPLVNKLSFKYFIKGYDSEDLKQIGFISLIKAINMYDINSSNSPVSYIKNTIEKNYFYEIRKNSKGNYIASLDKENDEGIRMIDLIQSTDNLEEDYILKNRRELLNKILGKLTCNERKLIQYAYGKKGLKAYGEEIGESYYTVRKMRDKILNKLREDIE